MLTYKYILSKVTQKLSNPDTDINTLFLYLTVYLGNEEWLECLINQGEVRSSDTFKEDFLNYLKE